MLKKLGYLGALLTCPCHVGFLVLVLGGTAVGAWVAAHLSLAMATFAAAFVFFLWLAMGPQRAAVGGDAACETCRPDVPGDAPSDAATGAGRNGVRPPVRPRAADDSVRPPGSPTPAA